MTRRSGSNCGLPRLRASFAACLAAACVAVAPALLGALEAGRESSEWTGVVEWEGVLETSQTGAIDDNRQGNVAVFSRFLEEQTTARFTLRRDQAWWHPERGRLQWRGEGTISTQFLARRNERSLSGSGLSLTARREGTVPAAHFSLQIETDKRRVSFGTGTATGSWTETEEGTRYYEETDPGTLRRYIRSEPYSETTQVQGAGATSRFETDYPLSGDHPGVLTFSFERTETDTLYGGGVVSTPRPQVMRRGRMVLWPVYADVELEVVIDGYEQWRPLGDVATPSRPGNQLGVRATLKPKNEAASRDMPEVRRLRFELEGVSHEPGVALNWPLGAKDSDPDLRLALADVPGELDREAQALTVERVPRDESERPFAVARVDAYDFGAVAELTVSAELDDGRTILGVLRTNAGDRRVIKLPQREGGAWVADVWRKRHEVATMPANDDGELDPRGDGQPGDGFTLYEEYRGFVEDGRHVEGHPKRRDFFILNLVGADARPGIALFGEISRLRVHSRLRPTEMSETLRLMNGNHREGPHRVDQHGVWIKQFLDDPGFTVEEVVTGTGTFKVKSFSGDPAQRRAARTGEQKLGKSGAVTVFTRDVVAGRPGITKGIGILARDDAYSDFNKPYNLPVGDRAVAYDRAIAHELLHSVGVEHHGEGNFRRTFNFQHANDPENPERRARFADATPEPAWGWVARVGFGNDSPVSAGTTLKVLEEGSNRDLAEAMAAQIEPAITAYRNSNQADLAQRAQRLAARAPGLKRSLDWWTQRLLYDTFSGGLDLHVGVEHGEDSGHQDCVMRYYFAQAYEKKGSETEYIFIPPGTNPIGVELCELPAGTGVNAAGRTPQSRHGDAAPGRGNCAAQVNPNDAVPPRKS